MDIFLYAITAIVALVAAVYAIRRFEKGKLSRISLFAVMLFLAMFVIGLNRETGAALFFTAIAILIREWLKSFENTGALEGISYLMALAVAIFISGFGVHLFTVFCVTIFAQLTLQKLLNIYSYQTPKSGPSG